MTPPFSHKYIRSLFDCSAHEGRLFWKVRLSDRTRIGSEAGAVSRDRKVIRINKTLYAFSTVIYFWFYGHWAKGPPHEVIDHNNRNAMDNRISNLKLVTQLENSRNRGPYNNSSTGYPGITKYWYGNGYVVNIKTNYIRTHIGIFGTLEEAIAARKQAEEKYWK